MATYLKFHQLEHSPFEGPGSERLVLATASLRRAYAEIRSGMQDDSPRICLSGGSGIGKSSFARAIPTLFESSARCALVREPDAEWSHLKASIARQLQLEGGQLSRASLMANRQDGRRIVLVIDRAEDLSAEALEHLDSLLGFRDDEGKQLVQCILLANLEDAPQGREIPLIWWLDQLATLQLRFSPIPEDGIRSYIDKHLEKAGFRGTSIFDDEAVTAIYRYTGGVPGAVSGLCEELLSRAAEQRQTGIDAHLVTRVCGDEAAVTSDAELQALRTDRRAIPLDEPDTFGQAEPELEIQQGLVHMDEPEAPEAPASFSHPADGGSSSSFKLPRRQPWPRRELGRLRSRQSPGSGRSARSVRNLMAIALLACLAMAIHLTFFTAEPAMPQLRKPIPPEIARAAAELLQPATDEAPAVAEAETRPVPEKPEVAKAEPQPAPALEPEEPVGLTSDLRLDPSTTNAAALAESPSPLPEMPTATGAAVTQSTRAVSKHAEPADKEPGGFEPWSEQAPEPTAAVSPAAPAPIP